MIFVGLMGKSEDYDLEVVRFIAKACQRLGHVELYLADPKDWR